MAITVKISNPLITAGASFDVDFTNSSPKDDSATVTVFVNDEAREFKLDDPKNKEQTVFVDRKDVTTGAISEWGTAKKGDKVRVDATTTSDSTKSSHTGTVVA